MVAFYLSDIPYYGNEQQIYLIKTDLHGNLKWENTYGGSMWDVGYAGLEIRRWLHNCWLFKQSRNFIGKYRYVINENRSKWHQVR